VVVMGGGCAAGGEGIGVGLPRGGVGGVAVGMPVVEGLGGHGVPVEVAPVERLCWGWVGHC